MINRLVVLISGTGSNMEALVEACRRGEVPAEVVAVVADRPCRGLRRAEMQGVETRVVEPRGYADRDAWSEALVEIVSDFVPTLVVSAGFMRILAPVFVNEFAGRLINLHPSLLPAFPGARAVRDALGAGVAETGTSVHFIDTGVDTGRVLLQQSVPIEEGDTEESLHERIKMAEHFLLPRACRLLLSKDHG